MPRSDIELSPENFRSLGHRLVDDIADFLRTLPSRPVGRSEKPSEIRTRIGLSNLPLKGETPAQILEQTVRLLTEYSTFNSHPRFQGYVTAPAAPIGILGDFLASAINPNSGAWVLSPAASEIEKQTVSWIAGMLGYPTNCGGLMVSGGNMANFIGFLAARRAKISEDIRTDGLRSTKVGTTRIYASTETHTWLQKAADLFGFGTDSIHWIPVDKERRMDISALRETIRSDFAAGEKPFLVVGSAGTVSTGAVDPLREISAICREHELWFHVDGAYGGFAAMLPQASSDLKALSEADSIAVDPHKWLYAPLECGCALVRNRKHLLDAFSYRPPYYHMSHDEGEEEQTNYYEYGFQNSRGFRALKVWLAIRQIGLEGYQQLISGDIELSKKLFEKIRSQDELEALTQSLSITTFRYVPADYRIKANTEQEYLNKLNTELLTKLNESGELFLSNAVLDGKFALRSCIVNFRTSEADLDATLETVVRHGRALHNQMRS